MYLYKSLTSSLGLADVDDKLDSINEKVKEKRDSKNKNKNENSKDTIGTHSKTTQSLPSLEKQEKALMSKVGFNMLGYDTMLKSKLWPHIIIT